jgi:hypothetical protein
MTALGIVLYGTIALLPLFLQTLLGYPAVQAVWPLVRWFGRLPQYYCRPADWQD